MYLVFDNGAKCSAISFLSYSGNGKVVKKTEQELNDLLSPILEEDETWQDKYRYLSLDGDGEVYLDEGRYEEEQEDEE